MADGDSIPERVRAQLLALGIPGAKHLPDHLASLFPTEFNIGEAGLNAEELARLLVHFAGQGLLSVSGRATTVKNVEPGWHFCQFYRDDRQLLKLTAPYIAEGLKRNEGCLWVVPATVSPEAACAAVARVVGNIDGYVASGQLEVLAHPDWYLDGSGRMKTFEQIAGALLEKQDRALANGFAFLRAAGDAGWVSGTEESREFIDYEMKVNVALRATKVAAICTYRADVTADEIVAIVAAHQDALYTPAA